MGKAMSKVQWVALPASTGLDEAGMDRWHREFERMSPQAHQAFLESLGIAPQEVEQIRADARGAKWKRAGAEQRPGGVRQCRSRARRSPPIAHALLAGRVFTRRRDAGQMTNGSPCLRFASFRVVSPLRARLFYRNGVVAVPASEG